MLRSKDLQRFVLLCGMALGVGVLTSATASAKPAVFGACANVGAEFGDSGLFATRAACLSDTVSAEGGPWVHAYPSTPTLALVCLEAVTGTYEDGSCQHTKASGGFELIKARIAVPKFEGVNVGATTIKGIVGGVATNVSCSTSKLDVQPEGTGKQSGGEITYSGCQVNKPTKCAVKEPVKAQFNGQAEGESSKFVDKLTGSGASEKFVETEFQNKSTTEKCALTGTLITVTGSQVCEFDPEITMMKTSHEVICKESGSSLKFGDEPVTYSGSDTIEASNKEWLGDIEAEI
jgi:hypothetical protein